MHTVSSSFLVFNTSSVHLPFSKAFSSSAMSCTSLSCQLRCMRCRRRRSTASRRSSSAARAPQAKLWRALKRSSGTGMSWDFHPDLLGWFVPVWWRFFLDFWELRRMMCEFYSDRFMGKICMVDCCVNLCYCYVIAMLWLFCGCFTATLWLLY